MEEKKVYLKTNMAIFTALHLEKKNVPAEHYWVGKANPFYSKEWPKK